MEWNEDRRGRDRGGFGGGFGRPSFSPVKVGDEIDVKIEAVGEKGDGIAKKKGFVLFVPNTKEGDEVRIKVTRVLKRVGFAESLGQAQGPIEADTPPPKASEPEQQYDQPAPQDSEDFGEDSEDFGEETKESEEQPEALEGDSQADEQLDETDSEEDEKKD